MKFKAILFDFNGLIIDDEGLHFELFKKVLSDEDIVLTDKNYWEDYLGFDDKGLFHAIYEREKRSLTAKQLKKLIAKKNELYFPAVKENLKIFPGVIDLINQIKDRYLLSIVSGALRSEIEFVLKEGNMKEAFVDIVSAEDTKRGKPDPEGFLISLTHLKKKNPEIRPENCLVLEDSHAGIEAAKRALMKVGALPHTYSKAELTKADYVFSNFEEVANLLSK